MQNVYISYNYYQCLDIWYICIYSIRWIKFDKKKNLSTSNNASISKVKKKEKFNSSSRARTRISPVRKEENIPLREQGLIQTWSPEEYLHRTATNREIRELNASFPRLCPFHGRPLCSLDNNDAIRPRKGVVVRREVEFARRKGSAKSARTFSIIADTSQRTKWRGLPWPEIVLGKPHFRPRSGPTPPIYFQGERYVFHSLSLSLSTSWPSLQHLRSSSFVFGQLPLPSLFHGESN